MAIARARWSKQQATRSRWSSIVGMFNVDAVHVSGKACWLSNTTNKNMRQKWSKLAQKFEQLRIHL
jgi:1,2-phenylacetyl-CoA epoxidase catalytic subunit